MGGFAVVPLRQVSNLTYFGKNIQQYTGSRCMAMGNYRNGHFLWAEVSAMQGHDKATATRPVLL